MKKTSIKRRVLFVVLGMSVASLSVFCATAFWGLFDIRAQIRESSAQLGWFATHNSSFFLEKEATNKLMAQAKDQSMIINERLTSIERRTVFLSDYTSDIYKRADKLSPLPIPFSTSANNGKLVMQLQSAGGKADYPKIKKEADLLGNVTSAYESNRGIMNLMAAIYLGTESGFSILYDPFSDDENQTFDPRDRSWYVGAKKNGVTFWTPPYVDAASGQLMVTCSYPFYGANGEFAGATGIDVIIENMNDEIVNIKAGASGHAFVIDTEGTIISSKELKKNEDGSYEKKRAYRDGHPEYNDIIRRMTEGESGIEKVQVDGEEVFIAYSQIPVTGWSVAIVLPSDEIMELVTENSSAIERMTEETLGVVNSKIVVTLTVFILIFAFSIVVIVYLSNKLSHNITSPIIRLKECHERIAGGELEARVDIKTGDELEQLGGSVNSMAHKLREYINNLQSVTAEKERIGAELDVATKIQASMLPCIFPAFPDHAEFDVYASMRPAKEVGGDFYDFFLVDENTLAIVMADVSGKGVPAALFMVIAKTLIKNNAQYGKSPKEVFENVNNLLCENNEAGMFVTAFMGYLDIKTGKFAFVNAGHNPPLLLSGGKWTYLKLKKGLVLAGMENMLYRQDEIVLQRGDELFLYTDGITEAMDPEKRLFGEERLLEAVNSYYSGAGLKEFTVSIKSDIDRFAREEPQADDITMLALRYKGL